MRCWIGIAVVGALTVVGNAARAQYRESDRVLRASGGATVSLTAGPLRRALARDPNVAAVVPFGRRGLLGLRPQGYVVVPRAPATVYRRYLIAQPQSIELGYRDDRDAVWSEVEPRGGYEPYESRYDRWGNAPEYGYDDRLLDRTHVDIERNLRPQTDDDSLREFAADERSFSSSRRSARGPEELPAPDEVDRAGERLQPSSGTARDIARNEAFSLGNERQSQPRVPPPPQPDPPNQTSGPVLRAVGDTTQVPAPTTDSKPAQSDNSAGPRLQDPSTGAAEF